MTGFTGPWVAGIHTVGDPYAHQVRCRNSAVGNRRRWRGAMRIWPGSSGVYAEHLCAARATESETVARSGSPKRSKGLPSASP